jgi:hypothetical protein
MPEKQFNNWSRDVEPKHTCYVNVVVELAEHLVLRLEMRRRLGFGPGRRLYFGARLLDNAEVVGVAIPAA